MIARGATVATISAWDDPNLFALKSTGRASGARHLVGNRHATPELLCIKVRARNWGTWLDSFNFDAGLDRYQVVQ